jgi:hypothetical protein
MREAGTGPRPRAPDPLPYVRDGRADCRPDGTHGVVRLGREGNGLLPDHDRSQLDRHQLDLGQPGSGLLGDRPQVSVLDLVGEPDALHREVEPAVRHDRDVRQVGERGAVARGDRR